MTNYERIISMTAEEMAENIAADEINQCDYCVYDNYSCSSDCEYGIAKWLEREEE